MSRGVDSAKGALWRERLARSRTCGLSVALFCAAEGVSVASYYAWRRKLGAARVRPTPSQPRTSTPRSPRAKSLQLESPPRAFQRLVVSGLAPAVTVRLPGDVAIEIPGGQEAALRAVVGELLRVGRLVEGASC